MRIQAKYQTFWKRFTAGIIDGIVFTPFAFLDYYFADKGTSIYTLWQFVYLILWTLYVIIGHGKYGQTIGKKAMNIKVLDINEKDFIGFKRAFYRDSIWIVIDFIGLIYSLLFSLGAINLSSTSLNFWLVNVPDYAISLWFILELLTMLFNSKRRALHDFMAKSVVVDRTQLEMELLNQRKIEYLSQMDKK